MKEWDTTVSGNTKFMYACEARQRFFHRREIAGMSADQEQVQILRTPALETVVDFAGSKATPFTVESFEARVKAWLNLPADRKRMPGFVAYANKLRDEALEHVLIPEMGAIPDNKKIRAVQKCFDPRPVPLSPFCLWAVSAWRLSIASSRRAASPLAWRDGSAEL